MKIPKTIVAIIGATVLEAINLVTVRYDSSTFVMVLIALLSLAGYEVVKKS